MSSNAKTDISLKLAHKLLVLHVQNLTSSINYKVNFTSNDSLTDTEFWIVAEYPTSSTNVQRITKTTQSSLLGSGTTHTTNTEAWNTTLTNRYEDTVTIPALAGVNNAIVNIYVVLAKPSIDVYVDPAVVIS